MERLFDYVAVVSNDDGKLALVNVFPEEKKDDTRGVLNFCWPEGKVDNKGEPRLPPPPPPPRPCLTHLPSLYSRHAV